VSRGTKKDSTARLGVLNADLAGQFGTWVEGTAVLVTETPEIGEGAVSIERVEKVGELPILNQMYGVPVEAIDFEEEGE